MPIFSNYSSQETLDRVGLQMQLPSIRDPQERQAWMSVGGYEQKGDSYDLALLMSESPELYSTSSLSSGMTFATPDSDNALQGMYGSNTSSDMSGTILQARRNYFIDTLSRFGGEENREVVSAFADQIYSRENAYREWRSRSGLFGMTPAMPGQGAGEDEQTLDTAARKMNQRYTYYGVAASKGMLGGRHHLDVDRLEIVQNLIKLGAINEGRLTDETTDEELIEILESAKRMPVFEPSLGMNTDAFPELEAEAASRGLSGLGTRLYVYDRAQSVAIQDLTKFINAEPGSYSQQEVNALMARVSAMSEVVGFDFIDEAMARVRQTNDTWGNSAWDNLPATRRQLLEENGYSKETFLRDENGDLLPQNSYSYGQLAMIEAQRIAHEDMREKMFEQDYHNGWFDWTERLQNTIGTDLMGDPMAMYFFVPTVATGIGAGVMLGSGSAAATTSFGTRMLYTAIDGGLAGLAEGYASGLGSQYNLMSTGARQEISWDHTSTAMLTYGAMGAIAGPALGSVFNLFGPSIRGASHVSNKVARLADTVAAEGYFGNATAQRAMNRMAERQATIAEIEGAAILSHIENQGLAIRLNRGDVEAREVLNEVLPALVGREGDEASEVAEDLFSSKYLADIGLSQADVVDLVFGLQRMLGTGQQIGADEFDVIISSFFRAAKAHSAEFLDETVDGTARRIAAIDAAVKSGAGRNLARFVGGIGKGLEDKEVFLLKKLTNKLKEGRLTEGEMKKIAGFVTRLDNEDVMENMRQMITNYNATGRLDQPSLREFNSMVNRAKLVGQKARESGVVRDALNVEAALKLLRNERTITVARELGVTPQQIMKYTNSLRGMVGDDDRLARFIAENKQVHDAVAKIAKGEGMEVLEGTRSSFDARAFLEESDVLETAREMQDLRKTAGRRVRKVLDNPELDSDALATRIDRVANRMRGRYRELAKKLGMNVEIDEAYDNLITQITADLPFRRLPSAIQSEKLSKAITRLIDAQAPDAVVPGARDVDGNFISRLLKGTSLGETIERNLSALSQWPVRQAKLFRSRNRIVRGISNWITGQHINNRVFSNSTDFMSVEAIQEGALRTALPYANFSKGVRTRLGAQGYNMFDTVFLYMRQKGYLTVDDIDLNNIPEGLRALVRQYDELGGEAALKADLKEAQKLYTHFITRAVEEANEAGIELSGDTTRYIPNSVKGGLSEERANQFIQGFVRNKIKTLLQDNAELDLELLHSMGWIKLTVGRQTDAAGNTKLNKQFTVPEDSPFWRGTDELSLEFADGVIKSGWAGLKVLDPPSATGRTGGAGSAGGELPLERRAVDVAKTFDEVDSIPGNTAEYPTPRTAAQATRSSRVAGIINGTDEELNGLEARLARLLRADDESIAQYQVVTGRDFDSDVDELMARIQHIRSQAVADIADEMESGVRPRVRLMEMDADARARYAQNPEAFAALSDGHRALNNRLNNLIVEGYIDEEAATILRFVFSDIDPHLMIGMSFTALDQTAAKYQGIAWEGGTIQLRKLSELADTNAAPVAALIVHETSHLAFLAANPRMQGIFQALFNKARAGDTRLSKLFKAYGIDPDYAMGNVHEFVAHLAEIALVRNDISYVTDDSVTKQAMNYLRTFFKNLIGNIFYREGGTAKLRKLPFTTAKDLAEIKKALKQMYNISGEVDDDILTGLERRFGVTPADEIDAYRLVDPEGSTTAGAAGKEEPGLNFSRPGELADDADVNKLHEKSAADAAVNGDAIDNAPAEVAPKPLRQVAAELTENQKRARSIKKALKEEFELRRTLTDKEKIEASDARIKDLRDEWRENLRARSEEEGGQTFADNPEGRVLKLQEEVSIRIKLIEDELEQQEEILRFISSDDEMSQLDKNSIIAGVRKKKAELLRDHQDLRFLRDHIATRQSKDGQEITGYFTPEGLKYKNLSAPEKGETKTRYLYVPRSFDDEGIDAFIKEAMTSARDFGKQDRSLKVKQKNRTSSLSTKDGDIDVPDTSSPESSSIALDQRAFDLRDHPDPEVRKASRRFRQADLMRQAFENLAAQQEEGSKRFARAEGKDSTTTSFNMGTTSEERREAAEAVLAEMKRLDEDLAKGLFKVDVIEHTGWVDEAQTKPRLLNGETLRRTKEVLENATEADEAEAARAAAKADAIEDRTAKEAEIKANLMNQSNNAADTTARVSGGETPGQVAERQTETPFPRKKATPKKRTEPKATELPERTQQIVENDELDEALITNTVALAQRPVEPETPAPKPEAPAPKPEAPIEKLSDDDLLERAAHLEAKAVDAGSLEPEELSAYNRVRDEVDRRAAPADGGDGGGKPPKAPAGAGDADDPRVPRWNIVEELQAVAARSTEDTKMVDRFGAKVTPGRFNTKHRLHKMGSLADIYEAGVRGSMDVLSETYKRELKRKGQAVMPALERVAKNYIDNAGGGFKGSVIADSAQMQDRIDILHSVDNMHRRTFQEADLDGPGGDEIAMLFAESASSVDGLVRYAETTLGSVRVQKALNELMGEEGATMGDLFKQVHSALNENLAADATGRKSLTSDEVSKKSDEYVDQLMSLYLRARGINPRKDDAFAQSSRIVQNLAYSMLGAKFAMSVLFVEAPLAVLRSSGLNPFKMIHNTSIIGKSLVDAAVGSASQSKTMSRWMSAMGIDTRIARETLEDMTDSISNLRSNSMARFGATSDQSMEDGALMFTLRDRLEAHYNNIKAAYRGDLHATDPSLPNRMTDLLESVTGASADLTGVMSFMAPVTLAVKSVAENQAKGTLMKHVPALSQLAKRLADAGTMTTDQLKGVGRELGLPPQVVVYAAESGLLSPGVMDSLFRLTGLDATSPGRALDLNKLADVVAGNRSVQRDGSAVIEGLDEMMETQLRAEERLVPSIQQFLRFFLHEMSPEMKGTMRFQGTNPLSDLMFQMLSYPMAAYQALVANGIHARGPLMVSGILTTLVGLEYFNRNAQRILFGKDEEDRKLAMDKLTRIPTQDDVIEMLAVYGTSSPLFGAFGNYVRDLVGNPILRATGHPDRNFPATPFRSPAIGMAQKAYGTLSRSAGQVGTGMRKDDYSGLGKAGSALGELALDISPFNALPLGTSAKAGMNVYDLYKSASVASTAGSARNIPHMANNQIVDAVPLRSFDADNPPQSLSEVRYPQQKMPTEFPGMAQPSQPQQAQDSAPETPDSASAGLADSLKKNQKN